MKEKDNEKDIDSLESFGMDMISEASEDDEEDLFVKKGETCSIKKTLIKGSVKKNKADIQTEIRNGKPTAKRCCGPMCFGLLGVKSVLGTDEKYKPFFTNTNTNTIQ
jgi:hypothetical protein